MYVCVYVEAQLFERIFPCVFPFHALLYYSFSFASIFSQYIKRVCLLSIFLMLTYTHTHTYKHSHIYNDENHRVSSSFVGEFCLFVYGFCTQCGLVLASEHLDICAFFQRSLYLVPYCYLWYVFV